MSLVPTCIRTPNHPTGSLVLTLIKSTGSRMQIPGERTSIFGFAIVNYIKQTVKVMRMRIIMIIQL